MVDLQFNLNANSPEEKSLEKVRSLAGELANLIKQSNEFQELLRLARLINLDPEVNQLIQEIRTKESAYGEDGNGRSIEELKKQLEALPAYAAYVKVEIAARDLFKSVDQVISAGACLDFAINARQSSCSCGG